MDIKKKNKNKRTGAKMGQRGMLALEKKRNLFSNADFSQSIFMEQKSDRGRTNERESEPKWKHQFSKKLK